MGRVWIKYPFKIVERDAGLGILLLYLADLTSKLSLHFDGLFDTVGEGQVE